MSSGCSVTFISPEDLSMSVDAIIYIYEVHATDVTYSLSLFSSNHRKLGCIDTKFALS